MLPRSIYKETASRQDAIASYHLIQRGQIRRDVALPRRNWREQQWHTTWGNVPAFPRRLRACRAASTSAFYPDRGRRRGLSLEERNYQSREERKFNVTSIAIFSDAKTKLSDANFYLRANKEETRIYVRAKCNFMQQEYNTQAYMCEQVYNRKKQSALKKKNKKECW